MEASSSSDEEDMVEKERIQAAASEELILHMMRIGKEDRKTFVKKDSLRKRESNDEQSDLVTTPEFREHVAKKLAAFLDRTVECDSTSVACESKKMPESGGIKLLLSSRTILTDAGCERDGSSRNSVKKSTRKSSSDESSSEEERKKFAAICVSGESILSSGEGAFKRKISSDVNDQNSVAKKNKLNGSAKKFKGKTNSSGT